MKQKSNTIFQNKVDSIFNMLPTSVGKIFSYKVLIRSLIDLNSHTIIDIGCGEGSVVAYISENIKLHKTGYDAYGPYVAQCKKAGIYDEYILADVKNIPKTINNQKYDTVLCLEVIEHLEKQDGFRLLDNLEKIGNRQIVLSTPVGFHRIKMYDNSEYQFHRSGWSPKEMRDRGYRVYGMTGFRFLRGERAGSLFSNLFLKVINSMFSYASQLICYRIPELAWGMICVKKITS